MTGPLRRGWPTQTRDNHGTVRRHAALAASLGSTWTQTADALGAGDLNVAQARVIVEALEALPDELGDDLVVKAEAYLVEQAAVFGPRELRHLGRGVLEHLAPEVADEAEYQRLLAEETRPRPRRGCRSRPAVTGPPTCTRGSPTTSPTGSGRTWTPTPPHAAAHSARSTSCRSPGVAVRRSWRSWRTCPTPGYPMAAPTRDGDPRPHTATDRCRDHVDRGPAAAPRPRPRHPPPPNGSTTFRRRDVTGSRHASGRRWWPSWVGWCSSRSRWSPRCTGPGAGRTIRRA